MEAFILTSENVEAFYPLLPEDSRETVPETGVVLIGAVERELDGTRQACGAMVMQMLNDVWLIRWLLVSPERRGFGAGTQMLELAQSIAEQTEMKLFCLFSEGDGDQGLYHLFSKHLFFISDREGKSYSIPVGELGNEQFFTTERNIDAAVKVLAEVPQQMLHTLNQTVTERDKMLVAPIDKQWASSDISVVYVEKNRIVACVIFEEIDENTVSLSFAYAEEKASMKLFTLLYRAQQLLRKKYSADAELIIPCVTDVSRKIVESLLTRAELVMRTYSAEWSPVE